MGGLLGEADPRIDHKRASADAGAACRYNTFLEFLGDLGNWILILRVLLHRRRGASKVPQNVLAVVASDRREHRPVGESARNIVDYACAGIEGRPSSACMHGVDRNGHSGLGYGSDYQKHPSRFDRGIDGLRARPR